VGPPGFEFPRASLHLTLPGFAGLFGAQLQRVIIHSSADPQYPLEPAVLAKLHYGPAEYHHIAANKRFLEPGPTHRVGFNLANS
jgi:hypothetical protein